MATTPYFVLSPSTVLSLIGLVRGPDRTPPQPAEDWRQAKVDVVVPALNEQRQIVLTLASLARQTLRPGRVILVDDGSRDHTVDYAQAFADSIGMELTIIRRRAPIGKTPTLKRQAREFDSDVQVILDGDTVLESDNYIERLVQELHQGAGIASACGVIQPMRPRDRRRYMLAEPVRGFLRTHPEVFYEMQAGRWHSFNRWITNLYRSVLYTFLQRFVYRGQMVFFGSIVNPVGCAVAYRRKFLKILFDRYEPRLGDNLTTSEDIFIGFALLEQGFRNIQVGDVSARSLEPQATRLPRQINLWSSAFFQSCYYFDDLMRSPFKALARRRLRQRERIDPEIRAQIERRRYPEAYRQPFGPGYTQRLGRPMGWVVFMSALEKVFFPTILLIMILHAWWEPLIVTVLVETAVSMSLLLVAARRQRLEMLVKGIVATPIRYASLMFDLVTMARFATDLWIRRHRGWTK